MIERNQHEVAQLMDRFGLKSDQLFSSMFPNMSKYNLSQIKSCYDTTINGDEYNIFGNNLMNTVKTFYQHFTENFELKKFSVKLKHLFESMMTIGNYTMACILNPEEYQLGLTQLSDWSEEEYRKLLGERSSDQIIQTYNRRWNNQLNSSNVSNNDRSVQQNNFNDRTSSNRNKNENQNNLNVNRGINRNINNNNNDRNDKDRNLPQRNGNSNNRNSENTRIDFDNRNLERNEDINSFKRVENFNDENTRGSRNQNQNQNKHVDRNENFNDTNRDNLNDRNHESNNDNNRRNNNFSFTNPLRQSNSNQNLNENNPERNGDSNSKEHNSQAIRFKRAIEVVSLCKAKNRSKLPSKFDWRTDGKVTPVKNQGSCGSCWTFTALAALESAYLIKGKSRNKNFDLSEQELLSCAKSNGCKGGTAVDAYNYILKHGGITDESTWPYNQKEESCNSKSNSKKAATIQDYCLRGKYVTLDGKPEQLNDQEIMYIVREFGPVYTTINADDLTKLKNLKKGVYKNKKCSKTTNHAVVIVGWDEKSWIIKNSWGRNWGHDGFFRMKRGENLCGINTYIMYPIV